MNLRIMKTLPLVGALLLSACGGGPDVSEAPRSQNDLCAIFDQRPGWRDAIAASERKWGAPAP
ncbi:MAG: hypothetical protein AAF293_19315, partial [Pseudomonadota bacterium]